MRSIRLILAILVLSVVCAGACSAYSPGDPEFRAIYVDGWHPGCWTASQIDQLITDAHSVHANTIVAQMRRRGDVLYPSPYEPWASGVTPGFDALAYLIQKCHSTSPRLDAQAWFVMLPVASETTPTDPNHPYNKYPQYLTKDENGNTLCSGDYWFDPGHPDAEQYLYNVIMDVVTRYNVDGINLDYIRYGGVHFGYNDVSVQRFNARYGRSGQPIFSDTTWSNWRRDQITNLVRKCYANAIALKPNIKITADVIGGSPAPSSLSTFQGTQAYSSYFQNWPAWMQEGILDMDMTMAYFDCDGNYAYCYEPWVCFTGNYAYNRQSSIAAGIYSSACMVEQLSETRNLACGPTNGAGVYAYLSMTSSIMNAIKSVWTTNAPVPTMTWKTSPTKGHIKGNVTFGGGAWVDGATVSIAGPVSDSMPTDGTGFFAFIDLPPGVYTVTCTSADYGQLTQQCVVAAGLVSSADFDYPLSSLVISSVQASEAATTATITWDTNGASSSKVYYGLDRTCSSSTIENTSLVTSHSVTITGLQPQTTYYYRVYSKNPSVPAALSNVCALVTTGNQPADIIIESRSGGRNYAWYSDTNMLDSTGKSSAAGLTATASRYGSLQAAYNRETHYKPAISIPGQYQVWVTWCSSSGGSDIKHTVTYNGGQYTTSFNQNSAAGLQNKWNLIGTFPFAAGASGSCGEVRQWANALESGTRIMGDAVKFSWLGDSAAPSNPLGLHSDSVQDDFINLSWVASTDNTGVAGYRITRDGNVIDTSPTNTYADTRVASNTRYAYSVSAYDAAGNRSGNSSTYNACTLPALPTYAKVSCDKAAGIWQTAGPFTFTAVGGFGVGTVNFYRCAWDTSPTHTWTGSEAPWNSGTFVCSATSSADGYYLHIKGYNQDSKPGDPADLGPYYVDSSAPGTPIVIDDGAYSASQTSVHAQWSSDEPESGIIGYQYAVGTTSGATNLLDWTTTTDSDLTIPIPSQSIGTTVYVSVRAQNGSKQWSEVGASDGIKIARTAASVSEAKSLSNATELFIPGRIVSGVFSSFFYVQDPDRAAGIRVEGICPFDVGTIVDVGGLLSINSQHERTLANGSVILPQQ